MMKLSQRMITSFSANISASGSQSWTSLSETTEDTIRVTTRKNTDPGQPSGVILTAVSTSWLPFNHQKVFELLADEQQRCQVLPIFTISNMHRIVLVLCFCCNKLEISSVFMDVLILQLEIMSSGGSLHEVAHIANGSHPKNCISLLRINVSISFLLLTVGACYSQPSYLRASRA